MLSSWTFDKFNRFMTVMCKPTKISEKYGVPVAEDACQTILGSVDSRNVNTWVYKEALLLQSIKNINI